MINLKSLLFKESKQPITEQPVGQYARYVRTAIDRLHKAIHVANPGPLDGLSAEQLIEIQTKLAEVENMISPKQDFNVASDAAVQAMRGLDKNPGE